MGIFSAKPKSFKIDRKSQLASNLSSSISSKLLQFLGNYSDDVLAEYITVLVCNGKHQYQARDDLEAFLGERSAEFVSWLWDVLLRCCPQSNKNMGPLNLKDSTVISPHESDEDEDAKANKLMDIENHGNGNADGTPNEDGRLHCLSANNHDPSSNGKEFTESLGCQGLAAPVDEFKAEILLEACGNEISRSVDSTEYVHDDGLTFVRTEKKVSSVISVGGEQYIHQMDKFEKTVNSKCNSLPNDLLCFAKREPVSRNLQSYISDSHPKYIPSANDAERSSSRAICKTSHKNDKSRGSVWDRLGKPCEDSLPKDTTDVLGVCTLDQQVLDQHLLSFSAANGIQSRNMIGEIPVPGNICEGLNQSGEYSRKTEHGVSAICELQVANNIGRKRHFGEISTRRSTASVCSVGEGNSNSQCKKNSKDFKKPNLVAEASKTFTPTRISAGKLETIKNGQNMAANVRPVQTEVLDMKLKLRQIEMEMSRLRSKQAEMKNDGTPRLLPSSGGLKHSEEDIESRTVFVTNVHFAATREALLKYFSKCGVVLDVIILIDKATSHMKGSAYIIFASMDSVDKAVALSGTSFFSRIVKIVRKSEAAATSAPAELAGKPQAQVSHINRKAASKRPYSSSHLQWRRNAVSARSEPSASAQIGDKGVVASSSQQQPSSSLATVMTSGAASLSTKTSTPA
ncbi:uncharacterized protein LOC131151623 isoform X2 [Malania oleifera]|uniref:uncharacterized protein LOC131151623 isoform X2 n=1 Tax=Malania oleifera TaxID=397392 RepID=UPI0025AE48D9|nr:uncharacterized protein LOC131151623 isoform X2 [Malania oleifera]